MAGAAQVRVVVRDDLRRSRLTVLLRGLLALPHLVWLSLLGSALLFVLPVQWVVTLVRGRPIAGLHEAYAMLANLSLHVYAYLFLAANPFPGFLGRPGRYPVDALVPPPARQRRWTVALRGLLVLPPALLSSALGSGLATSAGAAAGLGAGVAVAFLAWFACLARGAMPPGFRDVLVWALGYATQVAAYALLLTDRFPDSDPRAVPLRARTEHPVRMAFGGERRQHRLLVAFRGVLAAPHLVLLALWGVVALLASIVGWLAAMALGRLPGRLHRFGAAFVRYQAHVTAFLYLASGLFPGFTGRQGSYPLDLELAPPQRQSRWRVAVRLLLALPAFLVVSALGTAQLLAATGAWVAALVTGRVPEGLQHLVAYTVRYTGQVAAYALLLTDRYPHSGPGERAPRSWLDAPEAVLA